jgi:hypothetical protein
MSEMRTISEWLDEIRLPLAIGMFVGFLVGMWIASLILPTPPLNPGFIATWVHALCCAGICQAIAILGAVVSVFLRVRFGP